jgi:endonuclease IV
MSIGTHIDGDLIKLLGQKSYAGAAKSLFRERGVRCGQLFIMSPYQTSWVKLEDADMRACAANGFRMYAHANYLSHMCNAATVGVIHMQIKRAMELDLAGLVVHLENASIEDNVRAAIGLCEYRARVAAEMGVSKWAPLLFENNALTKAPVFDTGTKLKAFVHGVAAAGYEPRDFGVCIDTAHLWSCGQNIQLSSAMKAWLDEFDGARWIKLFHLNDNISPLGGKDLHAMIGYGSIWPIRSRGSDSRSHKYANIGRWPGVERDREPGFIEVLRYAKMHDIDVILERSKDDPALVLEEVENLRAVRESIRVS